MTEIRVVWQALQRMFPQVMKRPDLLKQYVRLHKPQSLRATQNGYMIEITGDIWVRIPSKKRRNPKPQVTKSIISVDGLELTSSVDIDVTALVRDGNMEELMKAMFLASLISLGIFTNEVHRKAFKKHMDL